MKQIAFIVQLPKNVSPGQRFRFEIWEPVLEENNFRIDTFPFINNRTYKILYKRGFLVKKTIGVISGFIRRFVLLFKLKKYDYIMLQRESAPIGPPVFEWIVAKILKKKIIYDFDDAIWIPNISAENSVVSSLKCFWKIKYICKWSYKVVGGNDYLCSFAKKYNKNVIEIPTCVNSLETGKRLNHQNSNRVSIGWTGSHSTLKYLKNIIPVIKDLQKEFDFIFLVIADKDPLLPVSNYQFHQWNILTEADDLLKIDIGIMPLVADAWSEGKCGFKLIQYFAYGIPAIASKVGVNNKIIEEGVSGFLCNTNEEWKTAIKKLMLDKPLRLQMGIAGRKKIEEYYCTQVQTQKYLRLFS